MPVRADVYCEHCQLMFPPVTGGSDVCDCTCHKSSYFQRAVGWIPPGS